MYFFLVSWCLWDEDIDGDAMRGAVTRVNGGKSRKGRTRAVSEGSVRWGQGGCQRVG
jgi:hypothetical protein